MDRRTSEVVEDLGALHDGRVPPPDDDHVRVYAQAGVGGMRALAWADMRRDDPSLQGWLEAGLVTLTDGRGQPAPEDLLAGCCGDRR